MTAPRLRHGINRPSTSQLFLITTSYKPIDLSKQHLTIISKKPFHTTPLTTHHNVRPLTNRPLPTNPKPSLRNRRQPVSTNPTEKAQQGFNASDNSASVDQRIPQKQASDAAGAHNAKFEEGAGIHGAPAGEERKGLTNEDVGRHKELDGEQMAAPGEGRVAAAVGGGRWDGWGWR